MNPKEIAVSPPSSAAETVTQSLVKVTGERKDKRAALRGQLHSDEVKSALIFCNRKRDVDILFRSLKRHGFSVAALHGDMAQPVRMETLERFKNRAVELLVCSDVAARGLDLPAVSHVFNFDVPVHAEDYIHRIGRTGRAGRSGQSFTLALPEEARALAAVTHLLGHQIPVFAAGGEAAWSQADAPERPGRRRRGRCKPEDRPLSKSASSKSAPRRAEAAEPVAAEPIPAQIEPAKPVAAEPKIAEAEAQTPTPRKTVPPRATKADSQSDVKDRPVKDRPVKDRPFNDRPVKDRPAKARTTKKPAGTIEPFGEHTPAFMLRPVNVA